MRTFKKIAKFTFCLLLIGSFGSITAFYTHPTFMEEIAGKHFGFIPFHNSPFKGKSEKCIEYEALAPQLNDRYFDYIWNSAYQKFGEVIKNKEEIKAYYKQKKLLLIDSSIVYVVDSLFYSYAFLTPDAKRLLDDIGILFQKNLSNTNLKHARILVTSLLRTSKTVKRLMRRNKNSLRISSHLHGTTFDLAHDEFKAEKNMTKVFSLSEIEYLKDVLAKTLFELRNQKRCFVTYEYRQACFHVVNRKD